MEYYLAVRFSPSNAALYIERVFSACHKIGLAPYRGTKRDDVRAGICSVGFERRISILFEIELETVIILGVSYAGRLPSTL